MRVELYKLLRKKTTYLLFFPLIVPLFWGVAMLLNINMELTEEGVTHEFISRGVGLFQFSYEMLNLANIFFIFIFLILASLLLAKEIETSEINLYVVRVGDRVKLIWARFMALLVVQTVFYALFFLVTSMLYLLVADLNAYGIESIWDADIRRYLIAIVAVYMGNMILLSLTLLMGIKLKTFTCFVTVFVLYVISLYFRQFTVWLQLLFPEHFASYVVQHGFSSVSMPSYFLLFVSYGLMFLGISVVLFKHKEL